MSILASLRTGWKEVRRKNCHANLRRLRWRRFRLPLHLEGLEERTLLSGLPELAITGASAPNTAIAGNADKLAVTWTVQNQGSATATAQWTDAVYLSATNTLTSKATHLTTQPATFSSPLAAGASYTDTQDVVLPNVAPGNYFLIVTTNDNNAQAETTPSTPFVLPITLTASNADLAVTQVNAPNSASAGTNTPIVVSWTVANKGSSAAAAGWSDAIFYSTKSTLDSSAQLLTTVYENGQGPLAAGASYSDYRQVTLPNLAARSGYILVQTNYSNTQSVTDTSNAVLAAPITVTAPNVNLAVSNASASASSAVAGNGTKVTVSYTVTNQGTDAATAGWSDALYLSTKSTFDDTAVELHSSDLGGQVPATLAAGASYTVKATVTIPNQAAGSYFVLVRTNDRNSQEDTNSSDDVAAIPLTLTTPNVDLAVTTATAPANAQSGAGQSISVSYTVANQGTDAAAAGWSDAIYLSSKSTLDDSATELYDYTLQSQIPTTLAAGGSYTAKATLNLPNVAAGNYYLLFRTNRYTEQGESDGGNDTNDVYAVAIALTNPQADLAITQTSAPSSAVAGNGGQISVSWTVKNQGTDTATAGWNDAVFLSDTPTYGSQAIQLYGQYLPPQTSLAAGASYTQTQNVTLPANTAAGNYYLLFVSDVDNAQAETDKANNVVAVPIAITTPKVDLTITAATAPASAIEGGPLAVSYTVKNQGTDTASTSWTDAVFVSDRPTLDSSYLSSFGGLNTYGDGSATFVQYLNPTITGGLAAGASFTQSQNITIPQTAVGNRYLIFVTNVNGTQSETDLTNNSFSVPIVLTAPDLTVTTASAPSTAILGQDLNVSWTVKNVGSVAAPASWYDAVYVSDKQTFDSSATFVQQFLEPPSSPLAAGASYVQNQTISIPQTAVGSRYLLFVTNINGVNGGIYYGNQPESNFANNVYAVPITLSAPDLTVTTASAPSTAILGQDLNVSWTVKNIGSVAAPAKWSDAVYVSDKQTWDSSATLVQSFSAPPTSPLAAGASYVQNQTISIPQTAIGNRYLLFVTNYEDVTGSTFYNSQGETDLSNNVYAVPISLTAPDLTVTAAASSSTLTAGDYVPISWTVKNIGSVAAPAKWYDAVYLSSKPTFDYTAQSINTFSAPPSSPLAAGASYTQSQYINVPGNAAPGTQYLLFMTNYEAVQGYTGGNQQGETDLTNNVYAVPVTIQSPDLTVTTATAPSSAVLGQSFGVSWTVKNIGSVTALGNWNDTVYVSDKQTLDSTATLIKTYSAASQPLAAGDFYVQNQTITLPQTATGNRYLLFVTNPPGSYYNSQSETNSANNTYAVPISLSAPDLTVTTATAPSSAVLGDKIDVSWTVKNQGSAAADASWSDTVYVSSKSTFDDTATQIGSFAAPKTLDAGASYTQTQSIALSQLPLGNVYLYVVANSDKGQGETDTTNDVYSLPITLSAPDLTVTTASGPSSATVGDKASLTWTVKNQGSVSADASWSDEIFLSSKSTYDYTAQYVGSFNAPQTLGAGTSYTQTQSVTIPASYASGSYYLLVVANSNRNQPEDDGTSLNSDGNDVYAIPITLNAPDLAVTSATAPSTAESGNGGTISVSWTVKNQGTVPVLGTNWYDAVYLSTKNSYDSSAQFIDSFYEGGHTGLAAGSSYTDTQNVTLPNVTPGSYYLIFQSNQYGSLGESDGSNGPNNTYIMPITVTQPNVKLAVGNISAPSTFTEGASTPISFTVTNNGTESASASWTDQVYLSDKQTFDSSAVSVGYFYSQSPLAAGASYTQSGNITLPQTATGNRYLLFVADSNNSQAQSDSSQSVVAVPITVQAPDLTVTAATAPSLGIQGNSIAVTWTVKNQGTVAAPATWYDAVYLSPTQHLQPYANLIASFYESSNSGLAAGASYNESQSITLPSYQTPGDYYLVVKTNYLGYQGETDTTNNTYALPIHISAPAADLVVSSVTAPSGGIEGGSVSISYTVKNQGSQAANAQWEDYVYLSDSPNIDSNSRFVKSILSPAGGLAAGASYTVNQDITLPAFTTGSAYLVIVANGNGAQSVLNAGDNTNAAPITLSAPSLAVTSATAPGQANLGDSIAVSWTVKNQGSVEAPATWRDSVYVSSNKTLDNNAQLIASFNAPPTSPLAAGASYTLNENITIPQTTAGNRYLLFVTDDDQGQPQTDTTNNVYALPIALGAPDLTVTSATAPSSANRGDTLATSWTVKNIGNVSADSAWQDAVYFNTTNALTGSARLLGSFSAPPSSPLAAGSSYTMNQNITVPANLTPGAGYLLFVTNSDGGQGESNANNDLYALPLQVNAPQLTVKSFTVPGSAQFGQSINVSWTVANTGGVELDQTWSDQIYLSTDSKFDASAQLLDTVSEASESPLAAGASYTQSASVTLPLDTTTTNGNYYLFVVVDAKDQVAIADRSQTISNQAIALTLPPLPALTASTVNLPASGYTGQKVVASWTETNNGTAAATGPWTDNLYLATDSKGDNPTLLAQVPYPNSLAAGQSVQLAVSVTLPNITGTYYLMVVTDADGAVQEGPNALQGTTVDATPITIQQALLPELIATSITPPNNGVFSGQSVPITFTVQNQGTGATTQPFWHDFVVLSQDPNLTFDGNSDQLLNNQPVLGYFTNVSALDVNQSYQQTVELKLPVDASGTWYAYVVPDGLGNHYATAMPELDRSKILARSAGFTVNLSPPADLQMTKVTSPPQAFSGQPLNLSWTVSNIGQGVTTSSQYTSASQAQHINQQRGVGNTDYTATQWSDAVFMSLTPTLDNKAISLGTFTHTGALQAGASYTQNAQVTLPVGVSGNYYFIVQTDVNGEVFENGATSNNVGATPSAITVNLTPPPELDVTSVTAPLTAVASHQLAVSYTITNSGAGATDSTVNSWTDSIYLSTTSTLDPNTATHLGDTTHYGTLNAGGSYTNAASFSLPDGISGAYYVFVVTDSSKAVFQLDRSHSTVAAAHAVQVVSNPADLVVSSVTAPAGGQSGQALNVTWTVANKGAGDTAVTSWLDNVYLDAGSSLSKNAVLLGTFAHNGLLGAGASYTTTQMVTLPIDTASGKYNLFVVTNAPVQGETSGAVYESNTSNDVSAPAPITIAQNLADLQVTAVSAPTTGATGTSITVNWTVANNGSAATNANYWYDDVYLSPTNTFDATTAVYLGSLMHVNPLAAGVSYQASSNFTLPQTVSAGNYYVIVVTNRTTQPPGTGGGVEEAYESNYSNNETAATQATAVTIGATPNLTVSNVTAPATAITGQPLTIDWTVTNNGSDTGNVDWNDNVYLSYDQVFSASTAIYLGSVTHSGGLAAGKSYNGTAAFTIPAGVTGPLYVFVKADSRNVVFERGSTSAEIAYDTKPVLVALPKPVDLVAGTITIPADAVPGQNITLSYNVSNQGPNTAQGQWYDALYLSPTNTFAYTDPFLGRVLHQGDVVSGGSYTGSLTAPVPAVAPGTYYVILRSDIFSQLNDSNRANNISASLNQVNLDVPALTLGTATNGKITPGQADYYKVTVDAGETLQFTLTGSDAKASNQLFVSYGTLPTRGQFDFEYSQPLQPNQQITVPQTQAGTYYVLVYGDSMSGTSENYSLTASIIPFAVTAVNPGHIGNAGPSTLEIDGGKFDGNTTFQLIDANGDAISASAMDRQSASTVYATFDLTNAPTGWYTVQATHADGTTATLAKGLLVVPGMGGNLQTSVKVPGITLAGHIGVINVTVSNNGDADVGAPIFTLLSSTNTPASLSPTNVTTNGIPQFLAVSPTGPAGVIRPGESFVIPVYFLASSNVGDPYEFDQAVTTAADPTPIDWSAVQSLIYPQRTQVPNWSTAYSYLQSSIGNTWGDFTAMLDHNAALLPKSVGDNTNPFDLLDLQVQKAIAAVSTSLSGQVASSDPGTNIAGQTVYAYDSSTGQAYSAPILNDGSFVIPTLPAGTYSLSVSNLLVASSSTSGTTLPPSVNVGQNQHLTGVTLNVVSGASISGTVLSQNGSTPIADALLTAVGSTGAIFNTSSDTNGKFSFAGLPADTYTVLADADGFARTFANNIALTAGSVPLTLTMAPEGIVSGTVSLGSGGPTGGTLQVTVEPDGNTDPNQQYTSQSQTNGFAVNGLPAGTYDVTLSLPGYVTQTLTGIKVSAGNATNLGSINMVVAATISGTVTSTDPQNSAANQEIDAFDTSGNIAASTTTDSTGKYTLTGLAAGTYFIVPVNATDIFTPAAVTLSAGQTQTGVNILLQPGATISGTVTDAASNALGGIAVFAIDPSGNELQAVTDSNGHYEFDGLGLGAYTVYLQNSQGANSIQTVNVTSLNAQQLTVNLQMTVEASITGIVTNASGTAIANATVYLFQNGSLVSSATTGSDGSYGFLILTPGTFDLQASALGASFAPVTGVSVASSGNVQENIKAGTGSLQVTLTDPLEAVAGDTLVVQLSTSNGLFMIADTTVGADGTASFANLAAGTYILEAISPDGSGVRQSLVLTSGQNAQVTLNLVEEGQASGQVTDLKGAPLTGASVTFTLQGDPSYQRYATTDANGNYSLSNLPAGDYDVLISDSGFQTVSATVTVATGANTLNFALPVKTITVSGKVVTAGGNPAPFCIVNVETDKGDVIGSAVTDTSGAYTIETGTGDGATLHVSVVSQGTVLEDKSFTFTDPGANGSKTVSVPTITLPNSVAQGLINNLTKAPQVPTFRPQAWLEAIINTTSATFETMPPPGEEDCPDCDDKYEEVLKAYQDKLDKAKDAVFAAGTLVYDAKTAESDFETGTNATVKNILTFAKDMAKLAQGTFDITGPSSGFQQSLQQLTTSLDALTTALTNLEQASDYKSATAALSNFGKAQDNLLKTTSGTLDTWLKLLDETGVPGAHTVQSLNQLLAAVNKDAENLSTDPYDKFEKDLDKTNESLKDFIDKGTEAVNSQVEYQQAINEYEDCVSEGMDKDPSDCDGDGSGGKDGDSDDNNKKPPKPPIPPGNSCPPHKTPPSNNNPPQPPNNNPPDPPKPPTPPNPNPDDPTPKPPTPPTPDDPNDLNKNNKGNPITDQDITDADGNVIGHRHFTYDGNGRITGETDTDVDGNVTGNKQYAYDSKTGKVTGETDTDAYGNTTGGKQYSYDKKTGAFTGETDTDAFGNATTSKQYSYDSKGKYTGETDTDAAGNVTGGKQYTYDPKTGKITGETDLGANGDTISGKQYAYDPKTGQYSGETDTDANGNVTGSKQYSWDSTAGKISEEKDYDASGNLTSDKHYTYDAKSHNVKEEDDYNASGSVISSKQYTYDPSTNAMIEEKDFNASGSVTSSKQYAYDKKTHNLIEENDYNASGSVTTTKQYTYDPTTGNVASEKDYDASGNLTGGTEYTYDSKTHKLTQETTLTTNGQVGYVEKWNYTGNGALTTYQITDPQGNTVINFQWTYNKNGQIAKTQIAVPGIGGADWYFKANSTGSTSNGSHKATPLADPPGGGGGGGGGGGSCSGGGNSGGAHDPNDILGPVGFGDQNFVPIGQVQNYQVLFENQASATLPAQQVVITDQLDPNLNWQSFRLGSFGWGGQIFNPPPNSAFYQTQIAQGNFLVDVAATIDVQTGVATWTFTTIDPTTGQIPTDPSIGFLPPDTANGVGQGFVSYSVSPSASDQTGTVIKAQATVIFDSNAPIDTPQIFNTLDASTPTATTTALPATGENKQLTVSWSGSAAPNSSAVANYTVYVSTDGGPFQAIQDQTTLTAVPFIGQAGHTYAFYTVASTNAGTSGPASPMVTTHINNDITGGSGGVSLTTNPGQTVGGVLATFTAVDPNGPASDFTAVIQWGDGQTSDGTIVSNGQGGFSVSGTHVYTAAGSYGVTFTITEPGGTSFTANDGVLVQSTMPPSPPPPPPITLSAAMAEGVPAFQQGLAIVQNLPQILASAGSISDATDKFFAAFSLFSDELALIRDLFIGLEYSLLKVQGPQSDALAADINSLVDDMQANPLFG